MAERRKILIVCLGGAGDTLMATPLLRELKRVYPNAALDVLTMQGAVARDVLRGNPSVSNVWHMDFMHVSWLRSLTFCLKLRKRRYDVSFTVMPQNRLEYNVITRLIGARQRIGFKFLIPCGALGGLLLTKQIPEQKIHLVENNLRLLSEGLGFPVSGKPEGLVLAVPEESFQCSENFISDSGLKGKRLIGLHPGSGTTKNLALRRWAPGKWAELCKLLGDDPEVRLVLFGSPDEAKLRREIIEKSGCEDGVIVEAPCGSILDTAALLKQMDAVVCCDTLLTHIAAALKVPQVVIMGPTPHWSVAPYNAPHRIVRLNLSCSPCYGYSKRGIRCTNPNYLECLRDLDAARVAEALAALPKAT